jgi:glycerol uptake facilitator-like aquaporin
MFGKSKVTMLVAELVGTAILSLVYINNGLRSNLLELPLLLALGGGLAMGVLSLMFNTSSGAQLNPALTVGLWTARRLKTLPAIAYIAMQLAGGAIALWVYTYLDKTHVASTGIHYDARIMIAEAIGTFIFAFTWAMAKAEKYEGLKLASAVGGAFAVGTLVATLASRGLIDPAVALSVRSFSWFTYVLGPVVGGIVGVNLYEMLFSATGMKMGMGSKLSAAVSSRSTSSTSSRSSSSSKSSSRSKKK